MVVDVVAVAADHTKFIAYSHSSLEVLKSANLLKSLNINVLIYGQDGVGKLSLASYISSNSQIIDVGEFEKVYPSLEENSTIIVKNFHLLTSYSDFENLINEKKLRLIATSKVSLKQEIYDRFFSISLQILGLEKRVEDILPLAKIFLEEYRKDLNDFDLKIDINSINLDLSRNCHSLKQSVYKACFYAKMTEKEIIEVLKNIILNKIGGKNDYKDLIYLFDLPLFRAGFEKFGSQLKMSEKFGLNRNTIRKKIQDLGDKL